MIIFNNAEALAIDHSFNYLGESLSYGRTNQFTIRGRFISDQTSDSSSETYYGVAYVEDTNIWYPLGAGEVSGISGLFPEYTGYLTYDDNNANVSLNDVDYTGILSGDRSPLYDIWSEMDNLRDSMQQFQEIILEGVSIGSGRVTSFNFPESRSPQQSVYEATIETYSTGDFTNLSSGVFSGIVADPEIWSRAISISEDIASTTDPLNNTNFSRSLRFDLINNELDVSGFIDVARTMATGLMSGDPALNNFQKAYPGYYQNEGRRVFQETYDLYNGSFSFDESFASSQTDNYLLDSSFSLNIGEDGGITCSERGQITINREPISSYIYNVFDTIKAGANQRVDDFFSGYAGMGCSQLYLNSSSQLFDLSRGLVNYSFDYNNDPFSSGGLFVTRTLDINMSNNGEVSLTENGSVKSSSYSSGSQNLDEAIQYFNTNISGGILDRLYDMYTGSPFDFVKGTCDDPTGYLPSGDLELVSKSNGYSEYNGIFNYDRNYSFKESSIDDNNFIVTFSQNLTNPIEKVWFGVSVGDGELAQSQNQASMYQDSQTIRVKSLETGRNINEYLSGALSGLQQPASTFYVSRFSYDFNPNRLELNLNVDYNYTGYRTGDSLNV